MKHLDINKIKSKIIQKIIDTDKNVIYINCLSIDVYYRVDGILVINYCKSEDHINDGPDSIEIPATELSKVFYTIDNYKVINQFKALTSNDLNNKYFRLVVRKTPKKDMHELADEWQVLGIKNIINDRIWFDTSCPV